MKVTAPLLAALLTVLWAAAALAGSSYSWRGIRVHESTAGDVKRSLGEPNQEYREQILYENQVFDPNDPNGKSIRLSTVVFNIGVQGTVESVFLSPEWGATDKDFRPFFGKGKRMSYRKFLATMGEGKVKFGAGTRPNEKLHYINLSAPCEFFPQSRVLFIYQRQDVVSGNYLVQFILFF